MLTRIVGLLVVLLAGLAPISASAQAVTPSGVTRKTAELAREVAPLVGHTAFEEPHRARSRVPFIVVGALVGAAVGVRQVKRTTAECDGCSLAGLVVVAGAAAGAVTGWMIHDAFFYSARPLRQGM